MHKGAWHSALVRLQSSRNLATCAYSRESAGMVRCLLKVGQHQEALDTALKILEAAPNANSSLSQYARLLIARGLRQTDRLPQAVQLLAIWVAEFPDNPQFRRLLGDFVIKLHGNWEVAERLLQPLQTYAAMQRELAWFAIKKKLYNGRFSPEDLARQIEAFSKSYLTADMPSDAPQQIEKNDNRSYSGRRRIGLISPFWCSSPVYFLCIGALKLLAQEFDLVFFSRQIRNDWATIEFQHLATEWHEVAGLPPHVLAGVLKKNQLDVLIDLGGWTDMQVMRALSLRPAAKQFKWVGGQIATTGLHGVFDGFISDQHQSPPSLAALYTEPLILIPGGYVTYTPPPYMPALHNPGVRRQEGPANVGIISTPMKVSQPFLHYLAGQIQFYQKQEGRPIVLQFVGWRFNDTRVQKRIDAALQIGPNRETGKVRVMYVPTRGHRDYLETIGRLDWVVDTFPFTCGVTALEAFALGVPLRTHPGTHFSARHGYSHARFCNHADSDISLQKLGPFGQSSLINTGLTLLPIDCPRADHTRLAQGLARLIHEACGNSIYAMS